MISALKIKCLLTTFIILLSVSICAESFPAGSSVVREEAFNGMKMPGPDEYWNSTICQGCHDSIYDQHQQSMHERSFDNPVFQAEYFNVLLKDLKGPGLANEARACIACHSPITYITNGQVYISSKEQAVPGMSGVTCDLCHTIKGYKGERPGNANYISSPGYQKLGPFQEDTDWHHVYSELQTKSEFCAICHNRVNHLGLEIISTYTEWKKSEYASRGIQCQDCHMNVQGFLTGGMPEYESGEAAHLNVGAPYRARLYTHRFPGAHSRTQVSGAITLKIETPGAAVSPGDDMTVEVIVDNSRTGHKMPSGSAELRIMVLELRAETGSGVIPVPAHSMMGAHSLDVAGDGEFDKRVLKNDVPEKSRLYRAVCVDEGGTQTLFPFDASRIIFDNRLKASEVRRETYSFRVPDTARGTINFIVSLRYLQYPSSFAEKVGVPAPAMIEIATAGRTVSVKY